MAHLHLCYSDSYSSIPFSLVSGMRRRHLSGQQIQRRKSLIKEGRNVEAAGRGRGPRAPESGQQLRRRSSGPISEAPPACPLETMYPKYSPKSSQGMGIPFLPAALRAKFPPFSTYVGAGQMKMNISSKKRQSFHRDGSDGDEIDPRCIAGCDLRFK